MTDTRNSGAAVVPATDRSEWLTSPAHYTSEELEIKGFQVMCDGDSLTLYWET